MGPVYFGRENDIFNAKRERERERERERDNKNGGYFDGLLLSEYSENENSPHVAVVKVRETVRCALSSRCARGDVLSSGGNLVLFFLPPPRRERCVVNSRGSFRIARERRREMRIIHPSSLLICAFSRFLILYSPSMDAACCDTCL